MTGEVYICYDSGAACATDNRFTDSYDFGASNPARYDSLTGILTPGSYPHKTLGAPTSCVYTPPTAPLIEPMTQGSRGGPTDTGTQSTINRETDRYTEAWDGVTCVSTPPFFSRTFGSLEQQLTDLDTAEQRLARLIHNLPEWEDTSTSWIECVGLPCCLSSWSLPDPETDLQGYLEGKVKVILSGATDEGVSVLRLFFTKTNIATGESSPGGSKSLVTYANLSTTPTEFQFEMPLREGYSFAITSARFYNLDLANAPDENN